MTTLVARQPLVSLPMSSIQRGPRRLSARLQEKDDGQPTLKGASNESRPANAAEDGKSAQGAQTTNGKKRKMGKSRNASGVLRFTDGRDAGYDEDDDGFTFTRVTKQKLRVPGLQANAASRIEEPEQPKLNGTTIAKVLTNGESSEPAKKRRNKMSFSTPKAVGEKPVRRSKRLSNENGATDGSPKPKARRKDVANIPEPEFRKSRLEEKPEVQQRQDRTPAPVPVSAETGDDHSATKIALPFADTPVIRRNKAMREGKIGKGDRRSSLGLRGRRASSLIETGNSNALPHAEVEVRDYYKHIESESLPEPKRMRQLLTWCATRAMGEKPSGTDFEEVSVKQAARVIQEELLKELSNKSELSDWFGREDAQQLETPLRERPHPKNIQNKQKIQELEEQIKRLRTEKDSLEALQKSPVFEQLPQEANVSGSQQVDPSLLSEYDLALWTSLQNSRTTAADISNRLNSISLVLGPTIDKFSDGIHKIDQYRTGAENVASRMLAVCAEKLDERDREGRRRATQDKDDRSPKRDLGSVLRSLSQVER